MYSAVWEQDRAPAPSTSPNLATNKKWKPISFLREIFDGITEVLSTLTKLRADVAALRAEVAALKKGN
jgi:hypothetical protein